MRCLLTDTSVSGQWLRWNQLLMIRICMIFFALSASRKSDRASALLYSYGRAPHNIFYRPFRCDPVLDFLNIDNCSAMSPREKKINPVKTASIAPVLTPLPRTTIGKPHINPPRMQMSEADINTRIGSKRMSMLRISMIVSNAVRVLTVLEPASL